MGKGVAPAIDDAELDGGGEVVEVGEVVSLGKGLANLAEVATFGIVGGASGEALDQVVAVGGDVAHGVASGFEGMENLDGALRGV